MDIELPSHDAYLSLTHNQHKEYGLTVQQAIDDEDHGYKKRDWISKKQMQKAINANECWTIQWYTQVGFCILSGYELDKLLNAANVLTV